jgi:hypothetical protein
MSLHLLIAVLLFEVIPIIENLGNLKEMIKIHKNDKCM